MLSKIIANPEFKLTLGLWLDLHEVPLWHSSLCFVQISVQMCAVLAHFSARLATLGSWWYTTMRQNSWRICNSEWARAETRAYNRNRIKDAATLPCKSSWPKGEPGPPKLRPLFASRVPLGSLDSLLKRRGTSPSKSLWISLLIPSPFMQGKWQAFRTT